MNENRVINIKGKEYKYIHNEKTAKFEKELFESSNGNLKVSTLK